MTLERLIEVLADYEHASWSRWMKYLFEKCMSVLETSELVIPEWAVERWTKQADTPYQFLSEQEKESDRKEVRMILSAINEYAEAQKEKSYQEGIEAKKADVLKRALEKWKPDDENYQRILDILSPQPLSQDAVAQGEPEKEWIGQWTDKQCPKCGATLLGNDIGDLWCSLIGCDYGLSEDVKSSPSTPEQECKHLEHCNCWRVYNKVCCQCGKEPKAST